MLLVRYIFICRGKALAIISAPGFSEIFTGSYKLLVHFFATGKDLAGYIFFYFVVMQTRNRDRNMCSEGKVNVRYKTLLANKSSQFEPRVKFSNSFFRSP